MEVEKQRRAVIDCLCNQTRAMSVLFKNLSTYFMTSPRVRAPLEIEFCRNERRYVRLDILDVRLRFCDQNILPLLLGHFFQYDSMGFMCFVAKLIRISVDHGEFH
ncbi:MAG: hypothetical protein OCD76_20190 [Reichenbachiella sp.]